MATPGSTDPTIKAAVPENDAAEVRNGVTGGTAPAEFADLAIEDIEQAPLLPLREPLGVRLASHVGRHHSVLLVLCMMLLWAITTLPPLWQPREYRLGTTAQENIIAPRSAVLPDHAETQRKREAAVALEPPVYDPNPQAKMQALAQLHLIAAAAQRATTPVAGTASAPALQVRRQRFLDEIEAAARAANAPSNTVSPSGVTLLPARVPSLSAKLIGELLAVPSTRWSVVGDAAESAVGAVYREGQVPSGIANEQALAQANIDRAIRGITQSAATPDFKLTPEEAPVATALARFVTQRNNLTINERATQAAQKRARAEVRAVYQYVKAGSPLIKAGETITAEKFEQLQLVGLVSSPPGWKTALARLMLCALLVLASATYLSLFRHDLIERPAVLWLLAMIPVLFLLCFRMLAQVQHADLAMIPLAATAAMLLTILIDARLGMVAGFVVAALCTIMGRTGIDLFLTATLSAWIGALAVSDIASRGQLVRAAIFLVVANAGLTSGFSILSLNGWQATPDAEETISLIAWSAIAGLFSVFATAGLAMLLERPFGITTHLRLLELLAPDEVVLRRMQSEAPGTYTHSLMVAMLSETAAKSVGADPLLCRVGGLYHDIGKLRRPHCFIENQSGENIHDRLSPQLSALVILAHVKDGLELGRALHLPQPVMDIIAQHHGTSLISYFYRRAAQDEQTIVAPAENGDNIANGDDVALATTTEVIKGGAKVDEAAFRYPGPRPQTKESAIVMLADTIEASARSLPNLSPEKLSRHINAMIAQRLQEGELSECEVTLRDLGKIEDSFVHVLRGVLHHRIEYPDPKRELEKGRDDSNTWVRDALAGTFSNEPRDGGAKGTKHGDNGVNGTVGVGSASSRRKRRRAAAQNGTAAPNGTQNGAHAQEQPVAQKTQAENGVDASVHNAATPTPSTHG